MKSIFRKFFYFSMSLISLLLICLTTYLFTIHNSVKDVEMELVTPIVNHELYDRDGQLLVKDNYLHQFVNLADISPHLIQAVLSTEDQTFFTNNGINPYRIVKATLENIASKKIISGASTITQQYVKNTYLSTDKTIDRKIKEIILSLKLNKKYTKEQILEAYLNSLLFGGSVYGIDMASQYYFAKKPSDLTISESAMLAGMIQLPNAYNPYTKADNANKRKNMVLRYMLNNQYISEEEFEKESLIDVADLLTTNAIKKENYTSSYLDYVNYFTRQEGIISNKQYTYLDLGMQKDFYDLANNTYGHFNNPEIKCALVAIDNNTGGVKALIGNQGSDSLIFNYALAKLQPGSTIKPLIDYAPAFEYLGYQPSSMILDEEYSYSNGTKIQNWDRQFKGKITLRYALKDSRNIPALKLYQELDGKQIEFMKRVGLSANEFYEADAIGGSTEGYSLLDLTSAYSAFANQGLYRRATPIQAYEVNQQKVDFKNNPKRVMKESTAFFVNSILHDVFAYSSYNIPATYLMGKTGQTNYDAETRMKYNIPESATKDSLLIAYTKSLTVGIWIGFDKISDSTYLMGGQKQIARKLMYAIMEKYAPKNEYYEVPEEITKVKIINHYGQIYLAGNEPDAYYEYFYKNNIPLTRKKEYDYLPV